MKRTGHIIVHAPWHPFHNQLNYVPEHRLVMEAFLGRYLHPEEEVHHIDGCGSNNELNNLVCCKNSNEHHRLHNKYSEEVKKNLYSEYMAEAVFRSGPEIDSEVNKDSSSIQLNSYDVFLINKLKERYNIDFDSARKLHDRLSSQKYYEYSKFKQR